MFAIIGRDNESVTHREWTMDRFFNEKENALEYIDRLNEACARWEFNITYYTREIPDPPKKAEKGATASVPTTQEWESHA